MKRAMVMILALALFMVSGCTYEKKIDGQTVSCVGKGWNVAMGILFCEVIVPPVVVLADAWKCPTRRRIPSEVK